MEFTSASANKYLRRLQDEKDRLLRTEQEVSTYVLAEGEAAEPPAYDYGAVREKVAQIDIAAELGWTRSTVSAHIPYILRRVEQAAVRMK